MRAGALDRRVTLLSPAPGADNGIEVVSPGFVPAGDRFASVRPEFRQERVDALGLTGKRVISVWLRWDSLTRTVDASWGLSYEGETFEIAGEPVEIGRRERIELTAVAVRLEVEED